MKALAVIAVAVFMLLIGGTVAYGVSSPQIKCGDFSTQQQAQAYYETHADGARLDADKDGKACEDLPNGRQVQVVPKGAANTGDGSSIN